MNILQQIYDSEINFEITTFWDGGFTARLGDNMNGFKAENTLDTFQDAVKFLAISAKNHYPESAFAKTQTA